MTLTSLELVRLGINPVGLARDAAHRYFLDGAGPLPSVTTVLGVVDKSGPLVGWAKRITAEAAVDNRADLEKWVELGGRDGAVGLLTKAASAKRDKAANAGSDVHQYAEAIVRGEAVEVPEDLVPFVTAYRKFLADFAPRFLAAEEMVASIEHGYAGTLDSIAEIAGETWLLDIKTGKGVYPEVAIQLAAYSRADFIGRPGIAQRFRVPAIDQYGVLHLRPEGYELIPVAVTDATFRAFLAAKALHTWRSGEATQVIGQPIGPALLQFPTQSAKEKTA